MEEKLLSLDFWLEEIETKDIFNLFYNEFLLQQIPLEIQEDEGLLAQVFWYGRDVCTKILFAKRPETLCFKVICEVKKKQWTWKKEVRERFSELSRRDNEIILSECALCVAWGIIYLENRDKSRVIFLNQMLKVWKSQWPFYKNYLSGKELPGKTKLNIMFELVKQYEEEKREEEENQKYKEAQKKANEGLAKMGHITTPGIIGNEMTESEGQNKLIEQQQRENAQLKEKVSTQEYEINELNKQLELDSTFIGIEWHDKVRLAVLIRLLQNDGADLEKRGNKAAAARLMKTITGLPLQTCKNFCTEPVVSSEEHKDELLQLNLELQRLGLKTRV